MKLYSLTKEQQEIEELFEECINEETGEIIESEELKTREKEFQLALEVKGLGIVKVVNEQEMNIELLDKEIKRLQNIKRVKTNKLNSFKGYIKHNMLEMGINKIETSFGNLVIGRSQALEIYDDKMIPSRFITSETVEKISKEDIKKAIKAGEEIQGARIVINNNLSVK